VIVLHNDEKYVYIVSYIYIYIMNRIVKYINADVIHIFDIIQRLFINLQLNDSCILLYSTTTTTIYLDRFCALCSF